MYKLILKHSYGSLREISILVARGPVVMNEYVRESHRFVQVKFAGKQAKQVQVESIDCTNGKEEIVIQLSGASKNARVHLISSFFVPLSSNL